MFYILLSLLLSVLCVFVTLTLLLYLEVAYLTPAQGLQLKIIQGGLTGTFTQMLSKCNF